MEKNRIRPVKVGKGVRTELLEAKRSFARCLT